jgi:hypothetical protein
MHRTVTIQEPGLTDNGPELEFNIDLNKIGD